MFDPSMHPLNIPLCSDALDLEYSTNLSDHVPKASHISSKSPDPNVTQYKSDIL
jgi:hypothetical protein